VLSDTHADNGNVEYKARNNPEKIEVKFDNALAFIQSKLNFLWHLECCFYISHVSKQLHAKTFVCERLYNWYLLFLC
jgi:hypothetical protein